MDSSAPVVMLEIVAGIILGLGAIVTIFWITFRLPRPRRRHDSTTSIAPNTDAEYLVRSLHDDSLS